MINNFTESMMTICQHDDVYGSRISNMWQLHVKKYQDMQEKDETRQQLEFYGITLIICGTFSFVVGFTMLLNHRFNRHPFRLFACQVLAYASFCYRVRYFLLMITDDGQIFLHWFTIPFAVASEFTTNINCEQIFEYTD